MVNTKVKVISKSNKKTKTNKKTKSDKKLIKKPEKSTKTDQKSEKSTKKSFILFRPFIKIGRYIKDSWGEMRGVRWPNRKYTWKMTIAVLVYCAIFLAFIVLLDALFSLIFNNLLG